MIDQLQSVQPGTTRASGDFSNGSWQGVDPYAPLNIGVLGAYQDSRSHFLEFVIRITAPGYMLESVRIDDSYQHILQITVLEAANAVQAEKHFVVRTDEDFAAADGWSLNFTVSTPKRKSKWVYTKGSAYTGFWNMVCKFLCRWFPKLPCCKRKP